MNNSLHVAISANERYMPGAMAAAMGVAVHSRPETLLHIHLFTEDVSDTSFETFSDKLRQNHSNIEVIHHECDENILEGLPFWAGSRMAAVRCHYATLMPDVDWCLYLDCDTLYLASVEEHFAFRDEKVYACVVREESAKTRYDECAWIRENCGAVIPDDKYFNSGVVLFNLKKMRADGIPRKLVEFFKSHQNVPSPDQDALNAVFSGCVRMLPPKFIRLLIFLDDAKMSERPVIHYVCGNPWLPKFGVSANNRFRLWHGFADKYIWHKEGESLRRCFTRRLLFWKYFQCWILKMPLIGNVFAYVMEVLGKTGDADAWRFNQVRFDISSKSILEVM